MIGPRSRKIPFLFIALCGCTSARHTLDRQVVVVDGHIARALEDEDRIHQRIGGGLTYRLERDEGVVVGARVRVMDGEASGSERFVRGGRYPAEEGAHQSGGLILGLDFEHWGIEAGANLMSPPSGDEQTLPWLNVRAGQLGRIWGELRLAPEDPLVFVNILGLGAALRLGDLEAYTGATLNGHLLHRRTDTGPQYDLTDPQVAGLIEVHLRWAWLGGLLTGLAGRDWMVKLGLSVTLDG